MDDTSNPDEEMPPVEYNEGLPAKCQSCGVVVNTGAERSNHYNATGHAGFSQTL